MPFAIHRVPVPVNEPVRAYAPGSPAKKSLKKRLDEMLSEQSEIPLIIGDHNSALPTLDSTRLLAHAAVDVALGQRPLPKWRGGPVQG